MCAAWLGDPRGVGGKKGGVARGADGVGGGGAWHQGGGAYGAAGAGRALGVGEIGAGFEVGCACDARWRGALVAGDRVVERVEAVEG